MDNLMNPDVSDTESEEGNLIIDESVIINSPGPLEATEEKQVGVQELDLAVGNQGQHQHQIQGFGAAGGGNPNAAAANHHHPSNVICLDSMRTPAVVRDEPGWKAYFNSQELSDIKIIVIGLNGQQKVFNGHKFLFSMKSRFFATTFQNPNYRSELTLLDVEPQTFEWFMNCVYETDDATKYFLPVTQNGMALTNLVELEKMAYRFQTKEVADQCDQAIIRHIFEPQYQINQIFKLWKSLSEKLPGSRPLRSVEELMDSHAFFLINTIEFLRLDQGTLIRFLSRDMLYVGSELDLFHSALRWAKTRCQEQGIPASQANIRQQLGPALYQIRFLTMDYDNLLKAFYDEDILTFHEICQIKNWFIGIERNPELITAEYPPFITRPRTLINRQLALYGGRPFCMCHGHGLA